MLFNASHRNIVGTLAVVFAVAALASCSRVPPVVKIVVA